MSRMELINEMNKYFTKTGIERIDERKKKGLVLRYTIEGSDEL